MAVFTVGRDSLISFNRSKSVRLRLISRLFSEACTCQVEYSNYPQYVKCSRLRHKWVHWNKNMHSIGQPSRTLISVRQNPTNKTFFFFFFPCWDDEAKGAHPADLFPPASNHTLVATGFFIKDTSHCDFSILDPFSGFISYLPAMSTPF